MQNKEPLRIIKKFNEDGIEKEYKFTITTFENDSILHTKERTLRELGNSEYSDVDFLKLFLKNITEKKYPILKWKLERNMLKIEDNLEYYVRLNEKELTEDVLNAFFEKFEKFNTRALDEYDNKTKDVVSLNLEGMHKMMNVDF